MDWSDQIFQFKFPHLNRGNTFYNDICNISKLFVRLLPPLFLLPHPFHQHLPLCQEKTGVKHPTHPTLMLLVLHAQYVWQISFQPFLPVGFNIKHSIRGGVWEVVKDLYMIYINEYSYVIGYFKSGNFFQAFLMTFCPSNIHLMHYRLKIDQIEQVALFWENRQPDWADFFNIGLIFLWTKRIEWLVHRLTGASTQW